MFERLTTPWGLVRFGVAPDHLATKSVIIGFERMTRDPRFRLWLNVEVGRDVSTEQLSERYHAVIYAVGAMGARDMGVPARTYQAATRPPNSSAGTTAILNMPTAPSTFRPNARS
jgi:NADPH-dependent glutamate synthase beta subunit-like oxidoreductase